jgi:hypothetical protein
MNGGTKMTRVKFLNFETKKLETVAESKNSYELNRLWEMTQNLTPQGWMANTQGLWDKINPWTTDRDGLPKHRSSMVGDIFEVNGKIL